MNFPSALRLDGDIRSALNDQVIKDLIQPAVESKVD